MVFLLFHACTTAGTDFVVENSECCFEAGQREAVCEIKINQDSDAEGEEDFTVSIVAKDGQCVCNKSLTCKIIDDPGTHVVFVYNNSVIAANHFNVFFLACNSVVEVEFNQTRYSVDEDAGFAYITVVSDTPAPAEFSVNVSFTDGTANGERIMYVQCTCVITFGKDTQGMDPSILYLLPP